MAIYAGKRGLIFTRGGFGRKKTYGLRYGGHYKFAVRNRRVFKKLWN